MPSGSELDRADVVAEEDRLLTAGEAARLLNLKNVGTIYHMVSQKRIPVVKLSARCIRFRRLALMEWVEHRSQSADDRD